MNINSIISRLIDCLQQSNSIVAETASLSQSIFLVTGGSSGIGAETVRALSAWGAHVLIACRNLSKGESLVNDIKQTFPGAKLTVLADADTSDLESMKKLVIRILKSDLPAIDGLILNAGIANHPYQLSRQGFELHCATNVLGHHLLTRGLMPKIVASRRKRIVFVTGDIYILANDCTLNHQYRIGKTIAYARSKLGLLWNALTLHEKRTSLGAEGVCSIAVHPGVVASQLIRDFDWLKRRLLISPKVGCQSSLVAATNPDICGGVYLHNTRGIVSFREGDPALLKERRLQFWNECEEAISVFLSSMETELHNAKQTDEAEPQVN